jgi:hypothetical protein
MRSCTQTGAGCIEGEGLDELVIEELGVGFVILTHVDKGVNEVVDVIVIIRGEFEAEIKGFELGEGDGAHLSNFALVPHPILHLNIKLESFPIALVLVLPKGVKRPANRYDV